jgi:hypothetical protein
MFDYIRVFYVYTTQTFLLRFIEKTTHQQVRFGKIHRKTNQATTNDINPRGSILHMSI